MLLVLREIIRNIARKPVTVEYGFKVDPTPTEYYRGLHRVDASKCISCGLCSLECPSDAIEMREYPEILDKKGKPRRFPVIHYYKCIFCYHCVDVCPVKAYVASNKPPDVVAEAENYLGEPLHMDKVMATSPS